MGWLRSFEIVWEHRSIAKESSTVNDPQGVVSRYVHSYLVITIPTSIHSFMGSVSCLPQVVQMGIFRLSSPYVFVVPRGFLVSKQHCLILGGPSQPPRHLVLYPASSGKQAYCLQSSSIGKYWICPASPLHN